MSVARSVESPGRGRIDIHDLWISEAVCSTFAPSVKRRGSCVTLQFIPMNKDQSLRVRLCWTQEKLAINLRRMGWPMIWKSARGLKVRLPLSNQPLAQFWLSELSIRNGMALSERRAWVFDLAGDFPL